MNILIWTPCSISPGGIRLLANLLPAIARQEDIELVRLVISNQNLFTERVPLDGISNIQVVEHDGPMRSDLIDDCHVVYFNWPHNGDFYPVDKPSVCTFQDTIGFDFPDLFPKFPREHFGSVYSMWLEKTTKVIVSSEHTRSRLMDLFGEHCKQCVVVPHAISPLSAFSQSPPSELNFSLPKEYIVNPSNITQHKNHLNLFRAYAQRTPEERIPLVLFGYQMRLLEYTEHTLPQEIADDCPHILAILQSGLILNEDYYVLGSIDDSEVASVIKNAKALIMPSFGEGGGSYPVEEALCLGTPVLCSDIPVMREHLSRRSAKVAWFNPAQPESIARALEDMVTNYDLYKQSAVDGMNDPTDTWDDIARKYISIFREAYSEYYGLDK